MSFRTHLGLGGQALGGSMLDGGADILDDVFARKGSATASAWPVS